MFKKLFVSLLYIASIMFVFLYGTDFHKTPEIYTFIAETYGTSMGEERAELDSVETEDFETVLRGTIVSTKEIQKHDGSFSGIVKRVIGVPGDTITFYQDKVYINGELENYGHISEQNFIYRVGMDEYMLGGTAAYEPIEITLGKDEYYLLGDNRAHSLDSRHYGIFTRDMILGVELKTIQNID